MQPSPEPAHRTPPTRAGRELASLGDRHNGWHLRYVHNYPAGDYAWCGKPEGALTGELQARVKLAALPASRTAARRLAVSF